LAHMILINFVIFNNILLYYWQIWIYLV